MCTFDGRAKGDTILRSLFDSAMDLQIAAQLTVSWFVSVAGESQYQSSGAIVFKHTFNLQRRED